MADGERVYKYVAGKIYAIENSRDNAAVLAKLRRAVGKDVGAVPEIWEWTLDLPDELSVGRNSDEPSKSEIAIHVALTLYAMHSQGSGDHVHNYKAGSIGNAAKTLRLQDPSKEKGIKRRFDALATAKSRKEIENHARGIIQLFKAGSISLDYARFAEDLFWLQIPSASSSVKLRWGRDFYSYNNLKEKGEDENE